MTDRRFTLIAGAVFVLALAAVTPNAGLEILLAGAAGLAVIWWTTRRPV